ncbi:MAG: ATP-binding protein [Lachnospira sp.]
MSLTNTQYASVMRVYDDIRSYNRHILDSRYDEVISLCPEFAEIDNNIISLSMKEATRRILSDNDSSYDTSYETELSELKRRKQELLSSLGKPADYLDDIFSCPFCRDTGYIGSDKCSCFKKKAVELLYRDSNLKNITADENFNTLSYDWYNKTQIDQETGLTPYNNMQKVVAICQEFVKNFDNTFSNLFLFGETGVGKTFLANCVARELLDSSHSVIYLTAGELFEAFENHDFKTSENTNVYDTSYFTDCDLLIIDDLGTESSNSYTNSKLFYVLNERILRKKSVVISTNLTIPQFEDRYSERIFSRIISSYQILRLFGDDIRYLKRIKH